jgi:FAD/FMN-containing dehydrogenase
MSTESVNEERLAELRATHRGPVLTPDGYGLDKPSAAWKGMGVLTYDEARMAWNGMYDRRPTVIVQPMGVADVQEAIRFARANDLQVGVRGGGHSSSGAGTIEGGMLIDLSLLRGVHVDTERRTAVAGGGTLLGELDRETQAHGLGVPSGAVSHTGIAGLTLYGGVGRIMRKFGLTLDNVLAYDIVTADGEWRHVDAEHHPDLFWALRGGGGQFGVVTHFHYQLHPLGPIVYGGFLGWPLAQAREVFQQVRDTVDSASDELQVQYLFVTGPPADFMPASLQGEPIMMMTATWAGQDLEEGARAIAPLRELVPPPLDLVGEFPYTMLQSAADVLAPHGRRNPGSVCGYLAAVTDDVFEIAIGLAETFPTPYTVIELSQMGGAVARVPAEATAAATARAAGWLYIVGGNCLDEAGVELVRDWSSKGEVSLTPHRLPGRYLNFVTDDVEETFREAFDEKTFARLQEVKAKYDPDAVFSYNPNRVKAVAQTA